jgi:hypothetical protein
MPTDLLTKTEYQKHADSKGDTVLPPTVKPRRSHHLALFVALLALTGCGVADYEKKMQDAEVRIQRFDQENRLLGNPLTFPPLPNGSPAPDFLRPPLGIASVSQKDEAPPYHYPATGGVCLGVYVALGDDPATVKKMIEDRFDVPAQNWPPVTVNPPNRKPNIFEAVEFNDSHNPAAVYQAYVHQSVGVVFHFLKVNREAAKPSIQMSLESYAEGGEASKASTDFNKRTKH